MLRIMKNNWYRLMEEKAYLITAIVLTVCAVGAAVILTNKVQMKGNIAVINESNATDISSSPYYNITFLNEKPPLSKLVQNRYDAVITMKKNGSFEIETIKSREFKKSLEKLLANPSGTTDISRNTRKIGTNIIGYMMMFLLMQGILYARLFAEDKEKHMIERVAMSPVPFEIYLTGQGMFMWLLIFIPSFAVMTIADLLGVSIGFSLLQYSILIGILSFLAVAFALSLNSFFCVSDTANMLGSSIIVLTSILAGSFYSFTKENSLLSRILHILPQKDFINFADAWEKGNLSSVTGREIGYVIIISCIMSVIAIVKTRNEYVYRK